MRKANPRPPPASRLPSPHLPSPVSPSSAHPHPLSRRNTDAAFCFYRQPLVVLFQFPASNHGIFRSASFFRSSVRPFVRSFVPCSAPFREMYQFRAPSDGPHLASFSFPSVSIQPFSDSVSSCKLRTVLPVARSYPFFSFAMPRNAVNEKRKKKRKLSSR